MNELPTPRSDGCLLCLVQASDSMCETAFAGPVSTKIDAALGVVGRLCADLVRSSAESPADRRAVDVGVLAYSTRPDGRPRLRPILPGATRDRPLLSLAELAGSGASHEANGYGVKIEAKTSGGAPAQRAMTFAATLLARWMAEHPGASPPVVVHCTDGRASDGPIGPAVASLRDTVPGAVIVHCLFRRGAAPSALVPIPETPCGDLWAMSSPYPIDEAADGADAPAYRSLFVNKLSAARAIGQLVQRLWSRAVPPASESQPTETGDAVGEAGPPPPSAAVTPDAEAGSEPAPQAEPAVPAGPPRFEWRALWMPKRGNDDREWEDGFAPDAAGGILAIADGASDGIFSKLWVDLLLRSFVARPLALDDLAAAEPWVQERRREWFEAVRYPEQRWSIQMKLDRSCGAGTFLGFRLDPPPPDGDAPDGAIGWTAWAVGDICLFHTRGGRLIASFPIARSVDFNTTPELYQSKEMRPTPRALVTRGELRPDDLIVFATDATAQRLLAEVESGTAPDWARFWDLDQETWRREIEAIRDHGAIVNDDCTLLIVRRTAASPTACVTTELDLADEPSMVQTPDEAGGVRSEAVFVEGLHGPGAAPEAEPDVTPPAVDHGEVDAVEAGTGDSPIERPRSDGGAP